VNPQRRTALVSVVAACALIALKLTTGLLTHSLGLLSEALHSGTDLVAALLTFFAIGVAIRPADRAHPYGHGKAEHLTALAEAVILVGIALAIVYQAVRHLVGSAPTRVDPRWYAFVVIGVVIAIDLGRAVISGRASRLYRSPALHANALHFGSDLLGSTAVLAGLLGAKAGYPKADSAAALLVAVLVLIAAGRLIRRNVDVLMDRTPADAQEAARRAIAGVEPEIQLRRLRMRSAAGRHFADVVIAVPPDSAVGQGHAAADAVEAAVERALPETDVVVHVEPREEDAVTRELAHAAAMSVPQVREIHNISVVHVDSRTEVSLHLKLPGDLSLGAAHAVASEVEHAIEKALPAVDAVRTHLEPLSEEAEGRSPHGPEVASEAASVTRIVSACTGGPPRELRLLRTADGLVVFLTLGLDPTTPLAEAHARASEIEELVRAELPGVADVIVHTEP
jgi:cation diffusion facilitator family transporter